MHFENPILAKQNILIVILQMALQIKIDMDMQEHNLPIQIPENPGNKRKKDSKCPFYILLGTKRCIITQTNFVSTDK